MPIMHSSYSYVDLVALAFGSLLLFSLVNALRRRVRTTKLPAPYARSWLFGLSREIFLDDKGDIFGEWYDELRAPVYALPGPFGSKSVVLMDPKAISYFYANDTHGFTHSEFTRRFFAKLVKIPSLK
jgi:hypothetical protein